MGNRFIRWFAILATLSCACVVPMEESAADFGITAATWSFATGDYAAAGLSPGLYAKAGTMLGLAPRLELELYGIAEAAPSPFRDCFLGAEAALPIAGSRVKNYFNAFLSLGFLQGWDCYDGNPGSKYISLRLTPLVIGKPYYGRRDRMFSIGALYELGEGDIVFIVSLLAFDFFPGADSAQSTPASSPALGDR
jgi:hypothetical protein